MGLLNSKKELELQPEQAKESVERLAWRVNRIDVLIRKQHKHLQAIAQELKEIHENINS